MVFPSRLGCKAVGCSTEPDLVKYQDWLKKLHVETHIASLTIYEENVTQLQWKLFYGKMGQVNVGQD